MKVNHSIVAMTRGALLMLCISVLALPALAAGQTSHAARHASASGAQFSLPFAADGPVWLEQKVSETNGAPDDAFSYSVAVSGSLAVVGATGANGGMGAAYVFAESNGTWVPVQTLGASDAQAGAGFGFSVSISGDSILVGSPYVNAGAGAAYVFTKSGGTWSQAAELVPDDAGSNYNSGWSVALDGGTALVSAPVAPVDGNPLAGAVYVFSGSGGVWSQAQKLTAGDVAGFADFGISVALDGSTAVIGASGLNSYFGAAYVFEQSNGTWTQTAKLLPSDGTILEFFGISVAVDDATALVGAYYQDVGANSHQGAAYLFTKSGGVWSQAQKLTANDGASGDRFGLAVALDGSRALVGAYNADVAGNSTQGAAYVFEEMNGSWAQVQKLNASDGAADDWFGNAVALSGNTALIGALNADVGGNSAEGAAYFYGRTVLDLALSVPQSVMQNEPYLSQTIVTNSASVNSPAVTAVIAVPAAASFVSANATQGSCSEAAGVVTCNFGPISGNAGMAAANVTLKAIGSPGTMIENTAGIARATPALTASAPTEITSPASCAAGYTEFSGHLDAGESFTSAPIEVAQAGQKYVDLTSPASFGFFAIVTTRFGTHTYVYPHVKHGHRRGAAGTYQVGVQAGATGGDFTLCVDLDSAP
ncbi:MAG: FG-GAP repeat protein [Gammaproteobacteria bacterium]|nr:FG-GAP repeat protein [Gammaproteobacteria bacterium]